MSAARVAALLLLLPISAGCLTGPKLVFEEGQQSQAEHDAARGLWSVVAQGRVLNRADQDARGVLLFLGLAPDCDGAPEFAHSAGLGSLVAGSSIQVREAFEQPGEAFAPHLWWRVTAEGMREQGCAALAA